jgi:metal-dependent amidase/aminoacylase/carboxypeptidase family protein
LPNIFDQTAELSGTVRTFNPELSKQLPGMIKRVVKNTCAAYRAECELDYYLDIPATVNDPNCSEIAAGSVKKILGKKDL